MSVLDTSVAIYKYFEEIAKIPHGSFNEEQISDYIENFAKQQDLKYNRDSMHNIIIYKPGSIGYETHDPIMLQGHMDMVNEKNNDSHHDFNSDPLDLYIEDGYLKARDTTLGADDGCGIVYMLAVLADKTLKHPPLTCVFTVQEEVGLLGAMNIKAKDIQAKKMIGLDSGSQSKICISSSGGRRTIIRKYVSFQSDGKPTYSLMVSGLQGGHSGSEISKEKGNANKIAIRVMYQLLISDIDIHIVNINGGLKENAIPRECEIIFNSAAPLQDIQKIVNQVLEDVKFELEFSDKDVHIAIAKHVRVINAIALKQSKEIIEMMYIMPNGFMHKSMVIPNLTTVSLNMGVVRIENNQLSIYYSIRSPMTSAKEDLSRQLHCIANVFGCECEVANDYPGWQYDENSAFRKQYVDFIKETEGVELISEASHGGLETGIFKGIIPDLDIITLGPDMDDIHTPEERLHLQSFKDSYQRLVRFLEIL